MGLPQQTGTESPVFKCEYLLQTVQTTVHSSWTWSSVYCVLAGTPSIIKRATLLFDGIYSPIGSMRLLSETQSTITLHSTSISAVSCGPSIVNSTIFLSTMIFIHLLLVSLFNYRDDVFPRCKIIESPTYLMTELHTFTKMRMFRDILYTQSLMYHCKLHFQHGFIH